MGSGTEPDAKPDHGASSRLECPVCGRVIRSTEADVLRFVRAGWPRCCGETMTLSSEPPTHVGGK